MFIYLKLAVAEKFSWAQPFLILKTTVCTADMRIHEALARSTDIIHIYVAVS